MDHLELLSQIQELQRQLFSMRQTLSTVETLSEVAFNRLDDQWPESLDVELNSLHKQFHCFQKVKSAGDFLDAIVAGRLQAAELLVDAESVAKRAASGLIAAFDTLNHEQAPSLGFTSWSWFEHAFREFIAKHLSWLNAAHELIPNSSFCKVIPPQKLQSGLHRSVPTLC